MYNKNKKTRKYKKYQKNKKNKKNKTLKKGGGFMYDMFFPKSCTVNSDCPDGQYCVLLSNEGLIPFYGYLHYFKNKPGQCQRWASWWKWNN